MRAAASVLLLLVLGCQGSSPPAVPSSSRTAPANPQPTAAPIETTRSVPAADPAADAAPTSPTTPPARSARPRSSNLFDVRCDNSCRLARNGRCEDESDRPMSGALLDPDVRMGSCARGTDCADCGPPRESPLPEVVRPEDEFPPGAAASDRGDDGHSGLPSAP